MYTRMPRRRRILERTDHDCINDARGRDLNPRDNGAT